MAEDSPISSEVSAGGDALASQYNNLRTDLFVHTHDEIGDPISNAGIDAAAAIVESKLLFNGSGHGHTGGSDGKLITINRAFTFGIKGTLSISNEQGMKFIIPQGMTVPKIWYKIGAGTNAGVRIQKNATTVDTFTATTSVGSTTSITSPALTAGQVLTLDITSLSGSPADLFVTVECTQP